MPKGPRYSITSCVVETAQRLIATPGDVEDSADRRRVGRALLTAEPQGFGPVADDESIRKHGQGLEVTLGFYEKQELRIVEKQLELVADELSDSIGGWGGAVQVGLTLLAQGEGWLGADFVWPEDTPYKHLDVILPEVNDAKRAGELCVIGRRLRYRLGVDHANGRPDLFWWTTPQTEYWIDQYMDEGSAAPTLDYWQRPDWGSRRRFNRNVGSLYWGIYPGSQTNIDASANSPDDWGYIDLDEDSIQVLAIGPPNGQTKADVETTLRRAGTQLDVSYEDVESERDRPPGEVQAEALERLADSDDPYCDVVLLYRGGFDWKKPISKAACRRIVDSAEQLVPLGIEVVLGLGHGTTSIHDKARSAPAIGVYEAVTPTAAANWILMEHVNQRLMNAVPDPGQVGN